MQNEKLEQSLWGQGQFSVLPITGANYKSCKIEMQNWNMGNQIVTSRAFKTKCVTIQCKQIN